MDNGKYHDLLSKAFQLAYKKHVQPNGDIDMRDFSPLPGQPFWTHLMNTHNYLVAWGEEDPEVLIASVLHDILEDTDVSYEYLSDEFSPRIAHLVKLVTKKKGFTDEDQEEYYATINQDYGAMKIKIMDRIDNLLTRSVHHRELRSIKNKIVETEKYYYNMAEKVGMTDQLNYTMNYLKERYKTLNGNSI